MKSHTNLPSPPCTTTQQAIPRCGNDAYHFLVKFTLNKRYSLVKLDGEKHLASSDYIL